MRAVIPTAAEWIQKASWLSPPVRVRNALTTARTMQMARTWLMPSRETAVRMEPIRSPPRWKAAEFAARSRRAVRAGSRSMIAATSDAPACSLSSTLWSWKTTVGRVGRFSPRASRSRMPLMM